MMMVRNGQTIVIGGLLNLFRQRIRSQVPLLGDIPFLGFLFGRNRWVEKKTEVIILISPQIVGPSPGPEMQRRLDVVYEREMQLLEEQFIELFGESFRSKVKR